MKSNNFRFTKNDKAFTGLEAAIVLIAFVVVAAVFSYVMLGAGFFTSQKSKEVVHTGVSMATSSMETNGDIVGEGSNSMLDTVKVTLSLTAGGNPVDIEKTVVALATKDKYDPNVFKTPATNIEWVLRDPAETDNLLESGEKVMLKLDVSSAGIGPNEVFTIEIKPPMGATLPITCTVPPSIDSVMRLA